MIPGLVRTIDCFAGSRPRSSRRSMRPSFSEPRNRLTGPRVESIEKTLDGDEQPAIAARGPIHHRPVRSASLDPGIEPPPQFSRRGIESHHFVRRRNAIHYAVDHDGLRLRIARAIRRVIGPGDLKPRDIRTVDLLQTGISNVRRPSAVSRPIAGRLAERGRQHESTRGDQSSHLHIPMDGPRSVIRQARKRKSNCPRRWPPAACLRSDN